MMLKILILIYICILLLYFLYYLRNHFLIPKLLIRNKEIHKKILPFLYDIQNSLEKNNIIYWMLSGGVIGYIRHDKSLIPWDDDLDLGILCENDFKEKINSFKKDIINQGYLFKDSFFGYQISLPDNSVTLDLFIYENQKDKIDFQSNKARKAWSNEYFYKYELFPLVEVHLNNQRTLFPKEYHKYIKRSMGESCLKEAKIYNVHKGSKIEWFIFHIFKHFKYDYQQ
jgi:lipopolysaccharide cholinephosphotransferase